MSFESTILSIDSSEAIDQVCINKIIPLANIVSPWQLSLPENISWSVYKDGGISEWQSVRILDFRACSLGRLVKFSGELCRV